MNSKYLWGLGSGQGMVVGADIQRAVADAQFAEALNPGVTDAFQQHETLRLECLALGVPLKGDERTSRLESLRNHYAAGKHLRQTASEGATAIKELAGHFQRILDGARKARNKRKRERRARRGK